MSESSGLALVIPINPLGYTDFYLMRSISAPIERVYAAWAERKIFEKWIVPSGQEISCLQHEVRLGGALNISIQNLFKMEYDRPVRCIRSDKNHCLRFSTLCKSEESNLEFNDVTYTIKFERVRSKFGAENTIYSFHIHYDTDENYEFAEANGEHSFWSSATERLNMLMMG